MSSHGELPPADDRLDDVVQLRRPPVSEEAEQSLLGCLLIDASSLAKVADLVAAPDFYSHAHKLIFDAIATMVAEKVPVDVVSVFERLERDGHAQDIGGLQYLNALAQSVPSAANMRRYAEIIVERATLRSIIGQADLIATRAFRQEPAIEILADLKATTAKLAEVRKLGHAGVPLLTLGQLREQSHAVSWLVKHVIPADSIGMLFGGSGTFKSFIAVDLACHIVHGLSWLGRRSRKGAVIYLAAEGGTGLWSRICAWHQARRLSYEQVPFYVVPVALDLTADAWKIVEAAQALGISPELVVVDTLSQTFAGEENSAQEVAAYFRELGMRIRQLWKCAVMILHHTGHLATERPRGSSAMRANLDWMLGLHRDDKEMLATLSCAKQKDGEPFQDTTFALTQHRLGTDEDGDEVKSLIARHLTSAEELQEAMEKEGRTGRGGGNQLLVSLLQNGGLEADLRTEFMKRCEQESPEARRQAYSRAKRWATSAGFFEVAQGIVVTLKAGGGRP